MWFLILHLYTVAPLVGAWIEIVFCVIFFCQINVAPLVGAWIEISHSGLFCKASAVAPLVGAWIEIGALVFLLSLLPCRSSCRSVD